MTKTGSPARAGALRASEQAFMSRRAPPGNRRKDKNGRNRGLSAPMCRACASTVRPSYDANKWFAAGLRGLAKGERSMANWDEDSITMAVEASRDCLTSHKAEDVRNLYFASTTHPFKDRQNAGVIGTALNVEQNLLGHRRRRLAEGRHLGADRRPQRLQGRRAVAGRRRRQAHGARRLGERAATTATAPRRCCAAPRT